MSTLTFLVALAILVGLVGIVVPILPGLLLSYGAIVVWVFATDGTGRWVVLALVTALMALSQVVKYLIPGKQLKSAGVPNKSIIIGTLAGIVGFFVIPVVGLFIGFIGGVFLAELSRLKTLELAWPSSLAALKAAATSILIELLAGLLMAAVWVAGVTAI